MSAVQYSLPAIECAIRDVCVALGETERPSTSWSNQSEDDLWRELVACILGSRVKFEVAYSAVERMHDMLLLSSSRRTACFDQYEQDAIAALSGGYPFYRMRANQIRRAAEHLYGTRGSIRGILNAARDGCGARRLLAAEVSGLGPKQASLFLRNIGYAKYVAVLDVHVLTYMNWVGLTNAPIKSVSTVRKYEMLEDAFIEHACSFGSAPDRFDLAVWVVVKTAKEESKSWG